MKQSTTPRRTLAAMGIFVLGGLAWSMGYASEANTSSPAVLRCLASNRADLSDLPDGPAQIQSASSVAANGRLPEYCDIHGYASHNTQFRVRVPVENWNGKLVVFGTGGQAGSIMPVGPSVLRETLGQGYAIVQENGGHVSTLLDSKWAWNDDSAVIDYAFRAAHVATMAGKAIVAELTGRAPRYTYFEGCSNGGRDALEMALRYPWDFNGIVAGDPSQAYGVLFLQIAWFEHWMRDDHSPGGLNQAALEVLHRGVLEQCHGDAHGVIENPQQCSVDLQKLQCRPGSRQSDCLTDQQVDIARHVYAGPPLSDRSALAPSGVMPGSELTWINYAHLLQGYPQEVFRYLAFDPAPGPSFRLDWTKLSEYQKRMGTMDALLSATDPDLRQYRDHGGKLIVYWGMSDPIGGVRRGIDYFKAVQRVAGGARQAATFARMFLVAGMNHCQGGPGAWDIDWTSAIDSWARKGQPPDAVTGTHPPADGEGGYTRKTAYYGSGARVNSSVRP